MAAMASDNLLPSLQITADDDNMDLLSDTGRPGNDFDIDIDLTGSQVGEQEIDYMLEDVADDPTSDGRRIGVQADDVMLDSAEYGSVVEAEMHDEEFAADELLPDAGDMASAAVPDIVVQNEGAVEQAVASGLNDPSTHSKAAAEGVEVSDFDNGLSEDWLDQHHPGPENLQELSEAAEPNEEELREAPDLSTELKHDLATDEQGASGEEFTPHSTPTRKNQHAGVAIDESSGPQSVASQVLLPKDSEQNSGTEGQESHAGGSVTRDSTKDEVHKSPETYGSDEYYLRTADFGESAGDFVDQVDKIEPVASVATHADEGDLDDLGQPKEEYISSPDDDYEEENDSDDGLTLPVMVEYGDDQISLFPPSEGDTAETYLLQDSNLAHQSFAELFRACRDVLGESIGDNNILQISADHLGLSIGEDSCDCDSATISQVMETYLSLNQNDGIETPSPLHITLTTKPRFSSRLRSLMQAAEQFKGYSSLPNLQSSAAEENADENGQDGSADEEPANFDESAAFANEDTEYAEADADAVQFVDPYDELEDEYQDEGYSEYHHDPETSQNYETTESYQPPHHDHNDSAESFKSNNERTDADDGLQNLNPGTPAKQTKEDFEDDLIDYDDDQEEDGSTGTIRGDAAQQENAETASGKEDEENAPVQTGRKIGAPDDKQGTSEHDATHEPPFDDHEYTDDPDLTSQTDAAVFGLVESQVNETPSDAYDAFLDDANQQASNSATEVGSTSAQPTGEASGLEWNGLTANEQNAEELDNEIDFGNEDDDAWDDNEPLGGGVALAEVGDIPQTPTAAVSATGEDEITYDEEDALEDMTPQGTNPHKGSSPGAKRPWEEIHEGESQEAIDQEVKRVRSQ